MNKMIPSELIHADKNGNAVIGKNLEIDGTTKLIGGIKAIKVYDYIGYTLEIYTEKANEDYENYYSFIGAVGDCLAIGTYKIENETITHLSFLRISPNGFEEFIDDNYFQIAIADNTQAKLYTHKLTLTAGTTNYALIYDCRSNTSADSIQSLRTLMNISSSSDSVNIPVVNLADLSTAGLQITTSLCKIGTANVTAVTDNVIEKA